MIVIGGSDGLMGYNIRMEWIGEWYISVEWIGEWYNISVEWNGRRYKSGFNNFRWIGGSLSLVCDITCESGLIVT